MTHKILIIDDSELTLEVCKTNLEAAGYQVIAFTLLEGSRAASLSLAESLAHKGIRPDLILLDVAMPGITGDELTRLFKKTWRIDIPTYLYSSCDVDELQALATNTGADGFICKDWGIERLVERVGEILAS